MPGGHGDPINMVVSYLPCLKHFFSGIYQYKRLSMFKTFFQQQNGEEQLDFCLPYMWSPYFSLHFFVSIYFKIFKGTRQEVAKIHSQILLGKIEYRLYFEKKILV